MKKISNSLQDQRRAADPKVDWGRCAAFLDFDGTLAPLEDRPDHVSLPNRERRLLCELSERCGGAVAILTGRDMSNIRPIFDGIPVILSGSHGAEIDIPCDLKPAPDADADAEIWHCYEVAKDMAATHDLLIERKPSAVALHYRNRPEMQDRVIAFINGLAETSPELQPLHGNMVSELTMRAYTKGTALIRIINHPNFSGRMPIAVGDDTTDENAFRAAQSMGGLGLRIGTAKTEANHVFATRTEFVDWLEYSRGAE